MSKTENRPAHSIKTVSQRTGLSLDVIRVWERRYKAVVPERMESGRRLYSDAQVSRLVMLRRATEHGLRIGEAAKAQDGELEQFLAKHSAANSAARVAERAQRTAAQDHLRVCIDAVRKTDADKFRDALRRAHIVLPVTILVEDVLGPLTTWIGEEWSAGALRIEQEQMASAALTTFLTDHARLDSRVPAGQSVLVTTPAGQLHELGALMVAMVCAAKGWRVDYPGPNLSANEIVARVNRTNPRIVALSIVYPEADPETAEQLRNIRRGVGGEVVILVGGRAAAGHTDTIRETGSSHCAGVAELGEILDGLEASAADETGVSTPRPWRELAAGW